ncbi:hypothetical protein QQP08_005590 [Theobroma cacao]|nr:hypothetical protein QQP08_005590 [Theobroma cacao]
MTSPYRKVNQHSIKSLNEIWIHAAKDGELEISNIKYFGCDVLVFLPPLMQKFHDQKGRKMVSPWLVADYPKCTRFLYFSIACVIWLVVVSWQLLLVRRRGDYGKGEGLILCDVDVREEPTMWAIPLNKEEKDLYIYMGE